MSLTSARRSVAYQRIDSGWLHKLRRSGWQGCTLFAGGEDVLDQTLLFWEEGKAGNRTLNLSLRVRRACDASVLQGLQQGPQVDHHEGAIPYPRKQVVAGEIHPLDRQWSLISGGALDAVWPGPVRVRYFPYSPASPAAETTPFSTQGSLTLILEGAQGEATEVHRLLEVLAALGLHTGLSTADDLELLYLRKLAWACQAEHFTDTPGELLEGLSVEERCRHLAQALSRHLGVRDLTRIPRFDSKPHFGTAYNPWAGALGSGEAGGPHWYRCDMESALRGPLASTYLGHDLAAQAPDLGNRIGRIIRSTGYLLSAEERWMRLGTPSQSIFGPQGHLGGATHVPMRLLSSVDDATLVFSPILLRRLDHVAVPPDAGGLGLTPALLAHRVQLSQVTGYAPFGVFLKRSVSLTDTLVRINVSNEADRAKVLEAFGHVGITRLRGVAVEQVVQVR